MTIKTITYNVKCGLPLILGHEGEHDNKIFKFEGFTRVFEDSSLYFYLQYRNKPIGKIILCDNAFVLIKAFTEISTRNGLTGQIKEHYMNGDVEEARECSDMFKVEVRGSIGEAETPEVTDEHVTLWGVALEQAYNRTVALVEDVQMRLDRGDFKGEKGDRGERGERGADGRDGTDYVITESDYEAIANIAKDKVDLSNYVEKEDGKVLSSNDFTDEDKEKLSELDDKMERKVLYLSNNSGSYILKDESQNVIDFSTLYNLIRDESNYVVVLVGNSKLRPQYVSQNEIHCDGEDRDSQGTMFLRMVMTSTTLSYGTFRIAEKSDIPTPYDDTEIKQEVTQLNKELGELDSRLSESITDISDSVPIIYGDLFGEFETVKSSRTHWLDTQRYAYISKDKPNDRDSYVDTVTMFLETNSSYANQRNIVFTFVSFDLNGDSISNIEEIDDIPICVSATENVYTFKFRNKYLLRKGRYIGFKAEFSSGETPNRIGSVYPDANCKYGVLVFNASGTRVDNISTWNVGMDFKMVNESEWLHSRPLYGKKWVAYGDSITSGNGLRGYSAEKEIYGGSTAESYVKKIADDFGMSFLNYGQSARGYSLSQSWNGEKIVFTLYDNTADIVTIAFGTNDFGEVSSFPTEFGDVDGTDTDVTNFCGAVRKTYETVKQRYTNVKTNVFILLPISRKTENTPNAYGKVLKDYVDAIRTIANKYHFPILDMWNDSGFKATQTNFADEYYQEGSIGALHPNEKGQGKYFVPIVKKFLIDKYRE